MEVWEGLQLLAIVNGRETEGRAVTCVSGHNVGDGTLWLRDTL